MITLSAQLVLRIGHVNSLKDKRSVAKSIVEKTRNKFGVSIAEVDTQDVHNLLTLGIAVVSGSRAHAQQVLDSAVRYIEGNPEAELVSVEMFC